MTATSARVVKPSGLSFEPAPFTMPFSASRAALSAAYGARLLQIGEAAQLLRAASFQLFAGSLQRSRCHRHHFLPCNRRIRIKRAIRAACCDTELLRGSNCFIVIGIFRDIGKVVWSSRLQTQRSNEQRNEVRAFHLRRRRVCFGRNAVYDAFRGHYLDRLLRPCMLAGHRRNAVQTRRRRC